MTDHNENPPASDEPLSVRPPQRPVFPTQSVPAATPPVAPPVGPPVLPQTPPQTYDEQVAAATREADADDRNPGRDPGKTLGTIGLVLAIPVSLLGLVLSILGIRKSKKAGRGNVIAWVGLVLSTLVILGTIAAGIFVLTVVQPQIALAQACAEEGPGEYTDQNGNPVTCE